MNRSVCASQAAPAARAQQRGIVLLVTLMVLLIVSLLVASAIKTAGLEETMALNAQIQNQTFQAAEGALSEVVRSEAAIVSAILAGGTTTASAASLSLGSETQLQRLKAESEIEYLGESICIGFSLDECRRYSVELVGRGFVDQDGTFGTRDDEGRTVLRQGYNRYSYVTEE